MNTITSMQDDNPNFNSPICIVMLCHDHDDNNDYVQKSQMMMMMLKIILYIHCNSSWDNVQYHTICVLCAVGTFSLTTCCSIVQVLYVPAKNYS